LDQQLYETFFVDKRQGFFVECGAFDGLTECTCKFFEESMGWTGLNIEPSPNIFKKLLLNRPNSLNENCALSNVNGTLKFDHVWHPDHGEHFGNGSLNHKPLHLAELHQQGCTFQTFQVPVVTFDVLFQKHNLPEIDLFVLDVEGSELESLQGIFKIPSSHLPKVFCIEHTLCGLEPLKKVMESNYTHHSSHAHNSFFVKKQ
jgi:FkbM family methyltransferase